MKKLSLIALILTLSLGLKAQTPSVATTIPATTTTTVTATMVKNADCQNFSFMIGTTAVMQGYVNMFGVPIETLVNSWGINSDHDTTYTWTEMIPGTEYNIYVVAMGGGDTVLFTTPATTQSVGSTGRSVISIDVSEITATSVRIICTPDTNTSVFYDGIVKRSYADSIGMDSIVSIILVNSAPYPQYATDNWVWQNLESATDFYGIAIGKNILGEWGDTTIVSFSTLLSLSDEIVLDNSIQVYPNPAKDELNYRIGADYDRASIYDIKGNLIFEQVIKQKQDRINISKLNNGIYFVRFSKQGLLGKATKFVIQK
jgi:hypothetical protein